MPKRRIPCHLYSFPLIKAGINKTLITEIIKGKSRINDELYPNNNLVFGIGKGFSNIAIPLTKIRLNKLAPIILPSDNKPCPFIKD